MNQNKKPQKKNNWWAWVVVVLLVAPELIPVLLIGGLIYWVVKNKGSLTKVD